MFEGLCIAGLLLIFCGVFPFLTKNDGPFLVTLNVPRPENDQLVVMIDERPAPGPVTACRPAALNKLFSVHLMVNAFSYRTQGFGLNYISEPPAGENQLLKT